MLLIAIVDDSEKERQTLAEIVTRYFNEKQETCVIHQYDNGVEFIRCRENFNIVFLDIQMDSMDGLDTARFLRIVNKEAQLIFVTCMAQMAIRGYEVDAMDFVVKPVDQYVIYRLLDKAIRRINDHEDISFALKTPGGIVSVSSKQIYYVEVYDHDLVYHTVNGDYKVRGRLEEVRKKLDERYFIQCNRSYLVNMRYMQSVHSDHVMVNDVRIQVSKSHRKEMEQRFINYLGESI